MSILGTEFFRFLMMKYINFLLCYDILFLYFIDSHLILSLFVCPSDALNYSLLYILSFLFNMHILNRTKCNFLHVIKKHKAKTYVYHFFQMEDDIK